MKKKNLVYLAILLLTVLHQDFWLWDDPTLVFGVLPAGLAYHVFYSIAAAAVWALAVRYAWPSEVEDFAEAENESDEAPPP